MTQVEELKFIVSTTLDVQQQQWWESIFDSDDTDLVVNEIADEYFRLHHPDVKSADNLSTSMQLGYALVALRPIDASYAWNLAGDLDEAGLLIQAEALFSRSAAFSDLSENESPDLATVPDSETYPDADPARFHSALALFRMNLRFAALCQWSKISDEEWRMDALADMYSMALSNIVDGRRGGGLPRRSDGNR